MRLGAILLAELAPGGNGMRSRHSDQRDETLTRSSTDSSDSSRVRSSPNSVPSDLTRSDESILVERVESSGAVPNKGSDAAYSRALSGTNDDPSTGCGTLANKIAYGAIDPINDDYSTLVAELSSQLERYASLPEAVDLRDRWSQCMTVKGYTFASFDDAYANYGSRPEITSDERAIVGRNDHCTDDLRPAGPQSAQPSAARLMSSASLTRYRCD